MTSKSRRPTIASPLLFFPFRCPTALRFRPSARLTGASSSSSLDIGTSQTLNYAKGTIGARWSAFDEDGDSLCYKVEIRGVKESGWKLLKDAVKEKYLSWDSTAFPDGEYVIRVTASDSPCNPRDQALEGRSRAIRS